MSHNHNFSFSKEAQVEEPVPVIQEETPAPVVEEAPKKIACKIIVTTIDGAVAQDNNGDNHRLYGSKYAAMKVGDIVEI